MPRLCEPCHFHYSDDTLTACPQCGGSTKFTLLPPAGESAEPLELHRDAPSEPVSRSSGNRMNWYLAGGAVALVAVIGLGLAITGNLGEGFEGRVKKLKPGMPMEQAARIMGDVPKPEKKKFTITIGGGDSTADRMPDFDRPMDYSGSGFVVYEGSTSGVKIHFQDGVVTRVEEVPREGGMRKRVTITK